MTSRISKTFREYRIIKKGEKYYPQVKEDRSIMVIRNFAFNFFRGDWKRIGIHSDGFGLYDADSFRYGVSLEKAEQVIKDYEQWLLDQSKPSIVVKEISIKTVC